MKMKETRKTDCEREITSDFQLQVEIGRMILGVRSRVDLLIRDTLTEKLAKFSYEDWEAAWDEKFEEWDSSTRKPKL